MAGARSAPRLAAIAELLRVSARWHSHEADLQVRDPDPAPAAVLFRSPKKATRPEWAPVLRKSASKQPS